jgi:hypothetical protein
VPSSFEKAKKQLELWVRQIVNLDSLGSKKISQRKTLESNKKQMKKTGRFTDKELAEKFKELEPVKLEPGTEHIASAFNALSATRSYGPTGGPMAITYVELKAFVELMDYGLEPWEVEAVQVMDRAYVEETYRSMTAGSKHGTTG